MYFLGFVLSQILFLSFTSTSIHDSDECTILPHLMPVMLKFALFPLTKLTSLSYLYWQLPFAWPPLYTLCNIIFPGRPQTKQAYSFDSLDSSRKVRIPLSRTIILFVYRSVCPLYLYIYIYVFLGIFVPQMDENPYKILSQSTWFHLENKGVQKDIFVFTIGNFFSYVWTNLRL